MSDGALGQLDRTGFFCDGSSRRRGGKESKNSCRDERLHICKRLENLKGNFEGLDQVDYLFQEMEM